MIRLDKNWIKMSTNLEGNLSLQHLRLELARLDCFVMQLAYRWRRAGQDPLEAFRGLYISDDEVKGLLNRSFASNWGATAELDADEEVAFKQAVMSAQEQIEKLRNTAREGGNRLLFDDFVQSFGLDDFERDVILICLAPTLDLRYERLYGYLQDDVSRKRPTINLALDLLCPPGPEKLFYLDYFTHGARLIKNNLLELHADYGTSTIAPLNQTITVEPTILFWLLGKYRPNTELAGGVQWLIPSETKELDKLLVEDFIFDITKIIGQPILAFTGPDQITQNAVARWIALNLEKGLLAADLHGLIGEDREASQILHSLLRDACLINAIPFFYNWDVCLQDDTSLRGLLDILVDYEDILILSSRQIWQPKGIDRKRVFFVYEFNMPAYPQRYRIWEHFVNQTEIQVPIDLSILAGQFTLSTSQIRDAVATARDMALQHNGVITLDELFIAARIHSNPRLSSMARKIVPRYQWEDIVLPLDQINLLHEIVDTVRGRPLVLDGWGLGRKLVSSKGITVLFAGPPGTGKTMAAEVIADELGLDLYKIDLSTVVSKYIGETEKNLERIFYEAEASNAILFFDEADALFGKRSEVKDSHDRYANIEISYLLQRMEAYDGVTILATNLRANLDEAFTRRLQFAVDFPFPEEADRLRIWKTLFPPDMPCGEDINLETLAKRYKLAGGNIRNILVSAAYLAASDGGVVEMSHIMHGTRRELQKMGRLVGDENYGLNG